MSFSILITSRLGPDAERQENLQAVLAGIGAAAPVLLVEQDTHPRLPLPRDMPGLARVFAYNPGPLNKSWGLNVAARHARTPWLVFTDPDLLAPGALQRLQAHAGSPAALIKPYLHEAALDPADSDALRRGAASAPELAARCAPSPAALCAGLFAMRAEAFWRLGGWDERFADAASADAAFGHRIERMRLPALAFEDAAALRLWQAALPPVPGAEALPELLARLRLLPAPEWERLLEVQGQLAGHREKHRPPA